MTKVKQLEARLGGRWRYCGQSTWECEDGRMVWAVWMIGTCLSDDDCDHPPRYYCYEKDKVPIEVRFEGQSILSINLNDSRLEKQ